MKTNRKPGTIDPYRLLKFPLGGMVGAVQGIGDIFKSRKRKEKEAADPNSARNITKQAFGTGNINLGRTISTLGLGEAVGGPIIGAAGEGLKIAGGLLKQGNNIKKTLPVVKNIAEGINKKVPFIKKVTQGIKDSNIIKKANTVRQGIENSGVGKAINKGLKLGKGTVKAGSAYVVQAGESPDVVESNIKSDDERRIELLNQNKQVGNNASKQSEKNVKEIINPEVNGQGNNPATNPVTSTQQEDMKVTGVKQQKDPDKQLNKDVQESGGVDNSPQYNTNNKNASTTYNTSTQSGEQKESSTNVSNTTDTGKENVTDATADTIKKIQDTYKNMVTSGATMEASDKYFFGAFDELNNTLKANGLEPVDIPLQTVNTSESKYNEYTNIPTTITPSNKENYNNIALIRQASTPITQSIDKSLSNASSMIYDPTTGDYKIKTLIETHKGDTAAADNLKSQFSSNKIPNSGVGMGKNFGITLDSLNTFLQEFKTYSGRFPEGNKLLQAAQDKVNTAINNNDVSAYQDALAKLKMTASDVANAINSDLYKTFGGDQVSLEGVPIYNQLRGIINGGYKVQNYYAKGYADVLKEVNDIGQSKLGIDYVGFDSYSARRKSMLVNNPLYKQMIERYATIPEIRTKLLADLYKPDITSEEKGFLTYISSNIQPGIVEQYHNLKDQYGSTKAKQMLPIYQDLYDLTGIPYRKTFDDYLDSMKAGLTEGSTFGNTTTITDQPKYNLPEENIGGGVQRVKVDNSSNYLNTIPSFKGIA